MNEDCSRNESCTRTKYAYDSLHRLTAKTYPSGSYASVTPEKHYVYDSATLNGVTMANAKGHLAEAYTGPSGSKITDEGFSYTSRGETADLYESTPHSGGWYHLSGTYWPNGLLHQLTAPGIPTITYAPDAEGRTSTVSAGTGQNPVTTTSYNVAGLVTGVTLGSSDSDSFNYDSNTNRITQYQFTVGSSSQHVTGALTWNANGSLALLAINDPFNSANAQTCTYSADDLSRVASVSCGSTWAQTFSYDPFGNVSKAGSGSWAATYSPATNRIAEVGSLYPSYDANGNLTNDTSHTYAWDSEGHSTTIDSVSLTYDASGRMVEQNRGGTYTEILYSVNGNKLALMNGSSLQKAFVKLPSGSAAVYSSSGLSYYRHPDHLGSSRFASTASRTMYYDGAYAPFGESYSETGTTDRSFTGQNQDTVSGLYDFSNREHSPAQGRWISPDPSGLAAVQLELPQSLNRYAYLLGNPLAMTDPVGLNGRCYDVASVTPKTSDEMRTITVSGAADPDVPDDTDSDREPSEEYQATTFCPGQNGGGGGGGGAPVEADGSFNGPSWDAGTSVVGSAQEQGEESADEGNYNSIRVTGCDLSGTCYGSATVVVNGQPVVTVTGFSNSQIDKLNAACGSGCTVSMPQVPMPLSGVKYLVPPQGSGSKGSNTDELSCSNNPTGCAILSNPVLRNANGVVQELAGLTAVVTAPVTLPAAASAAAAGANAVGAAVTPAETILVTGATSSAGQWLSNNVNFTFVWRTAGYVFRCARNRAQC